MTVTVPSGFQSLPLPLSQLSLAAVLKCGQSFRWSIFPLSATSNCDHSLSNEYRLCLRDRVVCLRQSSDTLFYRSVFPSTVPSPTKEVLREAETLAWLRDYFQLDVDLTKLYGEWSERDPVFEKLKLRFEGIRMLRQDPWENLVSFICSSNNNISRITRMVHSLCEYYSQPLLSLPPPFVSSEVTMEKLDSYHPFPPPSALAKPEVSSVLRSLGFGYRATFIQRTAKMLVDEHGGPSAISSGNSEPSERWLHGLRDVATAEAREKLLRFVGVGRKVADCILLMSLDKGEVIPVDTHVHQIAIKHYGLRGSSRVKQNMTPKIYEEVNTKLMGVWGEYAGWAHSVLFTADLKSFSSYGLPAPLQSPKISAKLQALKPVLPTPTTPSQLPLKRKRGHPSILEDSVPIATLASVGLATGSDQAQTVVIDSLAERVKRQRRVSKLS